MEMVYSAANNSFFAKNDVEKYEEAGWDLADVVDVTYDAYLEFIEDRTLQGQVRIAGADGLPAWGDIPPPTREELIADAEATILRLKAQANAEITWRQDAVDAGIATDEETATLSEWKKYRVLLMRVDTTKPVWPPHPTGQIS